jgi:hypothetical protein
MLRWRLSFTSRLSRLCGLTLALAIVHATGAIADPECHTQDNAAQRVASIMNSAAEQTARFNDKIAVAKGFLKDLDQKQPRPADYQVKADKLKTDIRGYEMSKSSVKTQADIATNGLKCHDTPSLVEKFVAAVNAGIRFPCARATVTPISGASAPTTGAKIPDPQKTSLAGVQFIFNCP